MKLKSKKLIAGLLLASFTAATALTGCGGGSDAQQGGGEAFCAEEPGQCRQGEDRLCHGRSCDAADRHAGDEGHP